jgi:RNA polymerase subunit RPABC4/transcription elongation factor Spt4
MADNETLFFYLMADHALDESTLDDELTTCPICHHDTVVWVVPVPEYAAYYYCRRCYTTVTSKSRDNCPTCHSTNIGQDTNGFFWCHAGGGCLTQWLNQ